MSVFREPERRAATSASLRFTWAAAHHLGLAVVMATLASLFQTGQWFALPHWALHFTAGLLTVWAFWEMYIRCLQKLRCGPVPAHFSRLSALLAFLLYLLILLLATQLHLIWPPSAMLLLLGGMFLLVRDAPAQRNALQAQRLRLKGIRFRPDGS